ncbi:MAG: site-2 protease family protein [Jatrophihabitantaceae bacterium]
MSSHEPPAGPPAGPPVEQPAANRRLVRLGSVLGVPIFVTPSWLIVVALVTLSYAGFLQQAIPGTSSPVSYLLAVLFAIGLGASVLLHEIGHTVVSRLLGLPVYRIVVFLLGGVSELSEQARRPRDEFVIAAAGPAVSMLLAGGCWLLSLPSAGDSAAGVLLLLLAWSNLVIAVFNVLPGLPLDGGRLAQALIWRLTGSRLRAIRIASWSGRVVAVLLALVMLAGNVVLHDQPGAQFATLTASVLGLAVAGFLWFGAGQSLRTAELTARTTTLQLHQLVRPAVYLPGDTPVAEAIRQLAAAQAGGIVVVDAQGRSRALVREAEVTRLPAAGRPWATVAQLARPLEQGMIISDDLPADQLLQTVRRTPASEYLVIGPDGVSRGVLATSDLARALGLRYRD